MGLIFNPRRIRLWTLTGFFAVLVITLISFLARQRPESRDRPLPPKIAPDVNQQTEAFSLSKTLGGHTLYTVVANQVTNFKDTGKTVLHDASILLYGKQGLRRDRISSRECEFDANTASFFIPGEVEMELGSPFAEPASSATREASNPIFVFTSGLSFDQNTGIASTDKEVRFRFAEGQGSSQGAIYNPEDQLLTLKADVRLILRPASPRVRNLPPGNSPADGQAGQAGEKEVTHVHATRLRFHRGRRRIYLRAPVEITQGTRKLYAGDSEIVLDRQHRAQRALLGGRVRAIDRNLLRSSELQANHGVLEFTAQGKVRTVFFEQDVSWTSRSSQSSKEAQAERVKLLFQGPDGLLNRIEAFENVRIVLGPPPASANVADRPDGQPAGPGKGARVLSAQQVEMILAPDGESLRQVRTQSSSTIELFPSKPAEYKRTVLGDRFEIQFGPEGDISQFAAEGNVRVADDGTGKRVSTSDHLHATFDSLTHSIDRMRQWGNFHYQEGARQARAERADYWAESDVVVLQGEPFVRNPTDRIAAQTISLNNATGEMSAEGKVFTTYFPLPSERGELPEPIHVIADRFHYNPEAKRARYRGTARLWQRGNFLEAEMLELDRQRGQLMARSGVYSVFHQHENPLKQEGDSPPRQEISPLSSSDPLEIRSDSLIYKEEERRAWYQGSVRLQNGSGQLTARELEILFAPGQAGAPAAPEAGSWQVERALAKGDVVIVQPTRKATGSRAEYFPAEGKVHLFGSPATVTDQQGRSTQGARLTYFMGDDRISVVGGPDVSTETRQQLHR